jgi:eukaryotic-like serine/threonine-protein kinase
MTLRQTIVRRIGDRGAFSEAEITNIAVAVTSSLVEAHGAGLVHRDLKPENIHLHELEGEPAQVKVLDFGLVKLIDSAWQLTAVASALGTPGYMSPEQVLGLALDGRSDLYSLGLILHELATGARPFRAHDPVEAAQARLKERPPDVRAHARAPISEPLAAIIDRALSRWPDDRFKDAREMKRALEACAAERDLRSPNAGTKKSVRAPDLEETEPIARTRASSDIETEALARARTPARARDDEDTSSD